MSKQAGFIFTVVLLLSLLATMSFPSAKAFGDSEPTAWWKLDEGVGTVVSDSSGNDYQGTIHGANWTNNEGNSSLDFNGVSDYVSLPSLDLTDVDSLTVVAWINSDLTEVGFIIYHGDLGEFEIGNGDLSAETQSLNINPTHANFNVKLSDSNWYHVESPSMEPNMWHQVVSVWIKGDLLKVYVDGVLAGENNNIPSLRLFNPGPSYPSSLGIYCQDQYNQQDFFKGQINNVMVFSKALTAQEIDALYATASALTKPALAVSCKSSTSYTGFNVEIEGSLTSNETVISDAPILLSYSVNGGKSWQDLTMVTTAPDGTYSATWHPSVTGIYLIKAVYEGNADYSGATEVVTLSVSQYEEENVFSVTSNSTVFSLTFNSNSKTLSFSVAGDSGTTGYTDVYIAKTLVPDAAGLEVYLDLTKLDHTVSSTETCWILSFTYTHSMHYVSIDLGIAGGNEESSTSLWTWILVVAATLAIGASILVCFRKHSH